MRGGSLLPSSWVAGWGDPGPAEPAADCSVLPSSSPVSSGSRAGAPGPAGPYLSLHPVAMWVREFQVFLPWKGSQQLTRVNLGVELIARSRLLWSLGRERLSPVISCPPPTWCQLHKPFLKGLIPSFFSEALSRKVFPVSHSTLLSCP